MRATKMRTAMGQTHYMEWDSMADLKGDIARTPEHILHSAFQFSHQYAQWMGRKLYSWDDVWQAMSAPWQKGLDTVADMTSRLMDSIPAPTSRVRRRRWSDNDGDEVCLDRLRAGLDFWSSFTREDVASPRTITVVTDMSTYSSVSHENILWRGAAAIALCHALEQAGYRVELLAIDKTHSAYRSGASQVSGVWLKRAGDTLDTAALVNAVSGWGFRTAWFGAIACAAGEMPDSSLGKPTKIMAADVAWFEQGEYMLVDEAFTFDAAMRVVSKHIESLNGGD